MRLGGLLSAFVAGSLLAACGGEITLSVSIDSVEPAFGPLSGGSRVVITGSGFLVGGAPPNRVIFGDREAPLAAAVDDRTLEVVIPPGAEPGEVNLIVFNDNGHTSASGKFRYSSPPSISGVTPDVLRYDEGGTVMITGSGFQSEEAGVTMVRIDGERAIDVEVVSDTQINFVAPPGRILTRANVVVENRRGLGELRGYQYGPGPQGGLLMFPVNSAQVFALFFDPLTLQVQQIPRLDQVNPAGRGWRAVFRNTANQYVGVDRADGTLYRIDLVDQTLTKLTTVGSAKYPDVIRIGTTYYAVEARTRFGSLDISNGALAQIGSGNVTGISGFALAADSGGILYLTQTEPQVDTIRTINRTTGALGTPQTLSPRAHVSAARFLGSTLYAFNRSGSSLITINPTNGATDAVVLNLGLSIGAMETVP
jgi:hypothetical protein